MPYFCATVIILSKSGSTGGGGFEGSSIFSQAASMYFSITPPGDCTISIRACASPTFLKACGVPRGAKKDSPALHVRSRSPADSRTFPPRRRTPHHRGDQCAEVPHLGERSRLRKARRRRRCLRPPP